MGNFTIPSLRRASARHSSPRAVPRRSLATQWQDGWTWTILEILVCTQQLRHMEFAFGISLTITCSAILRLYHVVHSGEKEHLGKLTN